MTAEAATGKSVATRLEGSTGFTAPQKAAMIIAALGPDAAGPIIERIGDKHLRAFAEAYAQLRTVPRRHLVAVVSEFLNELGGEDGEVRGGFEEARALISRFKSEETATKVLDEVPGGRSVWEKLADVEDTALAEYLAGQQPQAAAVILSRIDAEKASSVLGHFEPDFARRTLVRLAKPMPVRKEALNVLAEAVERDFLAPLRRASKAVRPGQMIGAMMNNMPEDKRDSLLEIIAAETPDILEEVKAQILTFKDIPARVPANAVPLVVREVDTDVFLKAVKYGRQNAPEAVEFIFKNISQRLGQQYQEQIEALKPVPVAEAEACQGQFMAAVRRLVAAGEFELNRIETDEADDEVYV